MSFAVPSWVVLFVAVVAAVVVAGLVIYLWLRAKRYEVPFKPLPGLYVRALYYSNTAEPDQILAALQNAASSLAQETKWSAQQIDAALQDVRVYVTATEAWVDAWGRKVGGAQIGYVVQTNVSLTSLCHEVAHYLEWKLDGEIDTEHASWGADGIWDADAAYRRWL